MWVCGGLPNPKKKNRIPPTIDQPTNQRQASRKRPPQAPRLPSGIKGALKVHYEALADEYCPVIKGGNVVRKHVVD